MEIQKVLDIYNKMKWRKVKSTFTFNTARVNPVALCSALLNSKSVIAGRVIKYTAIGVGASRAYRAFSTIPTGTNIANFMIAGAVTYAGTVAAKKVATRKLIRNSREKGTIPKELSEMIDDQTVTENYMDMMNMVAMRDELMLDVFNGWIEGDSLKQFTSKFDEMTKKVRSLSSKRSMVVSAMKKHGASKEDIRIVIDAFKAASDGSATLLPAIDKNNTV